MLWRKNKEDWAKRVIYLLALGLRVRESPHSIVRDRAPLAGVVRVLL